MLKIIRVWDLFWNQMVQIVKIYRITGLISWLGLSQNGTPLIWNIFNSPDFLSTFKFDSWDQLKAVAEATEKDAGYRKEQDQHKATIAGQRFANVFHPGVFPLGIISHFHRPVFWGFFRMVWVTSERYLFLMRSLSFCSWSFCVISLNFWVYQSVVRAENSFIFVRSSGVIPQLAQEVRNLVMQLALNGCNKSLELQWGEMLGGWLGRDQKASQRSREQRWRFEEAAVAINSTWYIPSTFRQKRWDHLERFLFLVVMLMLIFVVFLLFFWLSLLFVCVVCVVVVPREATELRDLQGKQQEEQSKATQEVQQRQGKLGFFRSLSVFDGKCLSLWRSYTLWNLY